MPFLAALAGLLMRVGGALLTTVIGKLLLALGVSVVSYKGADMLQQRFADLMRNHLTQLPPEALQLFYLAGGGVALNWIFGATAFALSLAAVSKVSSVFKT